MQYRAGALVLVSVLVGASACGSGHAAPSVPSKNAAYAWQPIPGGPALVCATGGPYHELIDYRGRPYFCKLPDAAHHGRSAGIDVFGPSTVSTTSVPLKPHQLRFQIDVGIYTRQTAVLRVDFGDGTHWQRLVTRRSRPLVEVVHTYGPTPNAFLLVTLRNENSRYLAVEGEGPFRAPLSGPRTRYCGRVTEGKGGTLSATESLPCAQAERLWSANESTYPFRARGYRCRSYGLPPWGSDTGVVSCRSGSRAFVYTSYA